MLTVSAAFLFDLSKVITHYHAPKGSAFAIDNILLSILIVVSNDY